MEKPKLEAGVVHGQDYLDLINWCKEARYALPAVNVSSSSTINAVLEAASKAKSDVIIQLSAGGSQFYAGQGLADKETAKTLGAISAAEHVHRLAKAYGVCVILHTDHANRKLLPWVDSLIDASEAEYAKNGHPLFSSHMIDLSEEPIDDNLEECAKRLERLSAIGMSLEIELGVTGGEEDGVGSDDIDEDKLYTNPEEVYQAQQRLGPLGHFTIAAAFGNVHGVYKPGNVMLKPEILQEAQKYAHERLGGEAKPYSFVFHGGSGSSQADFEKAINFGVVKVNIDTDTQFAYSKPIGDFVKSNPRAFEYQIDPDTDEPYKKKYDPRKSLRDAECGMAERVGVAFKAFGSAGQSLAA